MEKWLAGKRFLLNEKAVAKTEAYIAEFKESFFSDGLEKLE